MKVRFSSSKEHQPTVDGGLKVVYAPGKRAAFRLRWYLILLLVASPFLWFVGKLSMSLLLIEAPARTAQPLLDIRGLESGLVQQLHVTEGQQVAAGDLLLSLDSRSLLAQQQTLIAALEQHTVPNVSLRRQSQALQQQTERANIRVRELAGLVALGAATRGELDQARDHWNERQASLAAFEHSQEPSVEQQSLSRQREGELDVVKQRIEQLQVHAGVTAVVKEIMVNAGDAVGPGTLLMTLSTGNEPEIQVFLDTRQRELARAGQSLRLKLPDGRWVAARVASEPQLVTRLPPDLRSPFGNNELGLLLRVESEAPLPVEWQLDGVPMTARFPNHLLRWLE